MSPNRNRFQHEPITTNKKKMSYMLIDILIGIIISIFIMVPLTFVCYAMNLQHSKQFFLEQQRILITNIHNEMNVSGLEKNVSPVILFNSITLALRSGTIYKVEAALQHIQHDAPLATQKDILHIQKILIAVLPEYERNAKLIQFYSTKLNVLPFVSESTYSDSETKEVSSTSTNNTSGGNYNNNTANKISGAFAPK